TAHCANPGAMLGLAAPGAKVWLSRSHKPARKLCYSWKPIEVGTSERSTLVGINTARPNGAVAAAIERGLISALWGYGALAREVAYGERCRIDILLRSPDKPPCYVEVKNADPVREAGLAEFPDSVTARRANHLAELAKLVGTGTRAVMLFLVQRGDAEVFALARDLDPNYARAFDAAVRQGVEAMAIACALSIDGLLLPRPIPLLLRALRHAVANAIAHRHI
ncbi:MAG: DNA/RNA nuclease SfsA, partial [Methyloceanibacter sp.]